MRTCTYVLPKVDSPQAGAVELVRVEVHFPGIAVVRIVVSIRRIPLHDYFVLPVAVKVCRAGVVGLIGVDHPVLCDSALRFLERNRQVRLLPHCELRGLRPHLAVDYGIHLVERIEASIRIEQVRAAGNRLRRDLYSVTANLERYAGRIGRQQPPSHVHAFIDLNRNRSPV